MSGLPLPRGGFRVDELLIRPPVLDDAERMAPAFRDAYFYSLLRGE